MRRSRIIMGTGVSIDIPTAPEAVFEVAFKRLKDIDARFSPYKPGSELSKYNDGELSEPRLSREMKFIIHVCRRAEEKTGGYFSAWYGDHFEPSGYVKGWAIAEVGKMIKKAGYETFCIGIGGDILAASDGIKEWKVGVQDPDRKKYLTSQVFLKVPGADKGNGISVVVSGFSTAGNGGSFKDVDNIASSRSAR